MLKRVLIANRGEIALRILRACVEADIQTVAAYSKVDAALIHLKLADDIVCISARGYLDINAMVMAARNFGCDAIHPGYGFLAENADFAAATEDAGLKFIGPSSETLRIMGDKAAARELARSTGTKPVPGSDVVEGLPAALEIGSELGYPIALKAVHGGGGRGIRIVTSEGGLPSGLLQARAEALAAFGDGDVYIEKYLTFPRHIEVQIVGDGHGNVIHLGTRECSIQRLHQKLLEEAPAINLPPGVESALIDSALKIGTALKFRSAGTLEFLLADDEFYFIEMNARIQVEHPVSEMVTGVDIVKLQLHIATTGNLPIVQSAIDIRGHAIECRINAEDDEFRPAPGVIQDLRLPGGPGVRVDTHLYEGYEVPHEYDSLIAKIISNGATRHEALVRMSRALSELNIGGLSHNVALHQKILRHKDFQESSVDTNFLHKILG